jgi:anti-sigma regulatory factor (Ser/Thr protein kinase)
LSDQQQSTTSAAEQPLVHEALLYRSPNELGDRVRDYVLEGSVAREPVLVVLPEANIELLGNALKDAAVEVRFEHMSEVGRNPCCLLSVYQTWIDEHAGPVRIIGEPVWPGRSDPEVIECLRHEALMNHALAKTQVSLLCPYDAAELDGETLAGATLTHPRLVRNGLRSDSVDYGEPLDIHTGSRWPQSEAIEPVSEHFFDGDLHALREAVADDPLLGGLPKARQSDLVFAVNEAATNAIKHGDGHCRARIWREYDAVVSEVATATQISDPMAGCVRPSVEALDGRGLWLINQLCDLVELRSGEAGTTVRMHLRAAQD